MAHYKMTENVMLKQAIQSNVEMSECSSNHEATLGAEDRSQQVETSAEIGNMAHYLSDLMDLARDHRTTPSEFLKKARECPNDLSITDSFKPLRSKTQERSAFLKAVGNPASISGSSDSFDSNKELITSRITPKMGEVLRAAREKAKAAAAAAAINFFDSGNNKETHLNPLHIFFGHAKDISGKFIVEIDKLDGGCLTRLSSLNRTPLHHFMERNKHIDPRCLVSFYRTDPQAFLRLDLHRHTPLDRYFKHNPNSTFNPMTDPIVHTLCASVGHWGLDALSKSSEAYRNRHHRKTRSASFAGGGGGPTISNIPTPSSNGSDTIVGEMSPEFKVLVNGDPYQVEAFIGNMMRDGSAEETFANLKFLFVVVPLRAPSKYGLTSTQGLQLVSRVLTTTADVYAGELGEVSAATKKRWMKAFVDAAIHMIHDETLLKGMLTDSPSKEAIEALASTEFMSRVLKFKFLSGTSLIFFFEFALFVLLFALVVTSILSVANDLSVSVVGFIITLYFTIRELHHMHMLRHQELAETDGHENNHIHKFGHLYSRTFRPSLPGLPQGAGSRASIMHPSTISTGLLDSESDEMSMRKKDEMDEELLKHRYGGSGSKSIHGVMHRLKSPSREEGGMRNSNDETTEEEGEEDNTPIPLPGQQSQNTCIHTFRRQNTLSDDGDHIDPAYEEVDDHFSTRSKRREFQDKISHDITLHLGIAVAWRNNAFNWINAFSLLGSWITLIHRFLKDLHVKMDDGKFILLLNVTTVVFLWLRFLGFLRGTNIKMATFILMLQEIAQNVDIFLVVLALILVMFAMLYHILLVNNNRLEDDEWSNFDTSLWKVWGYAIGEVDDTAFPTESSYFLFTAFGLSIVIIMMNILIAIVSDSYTDAMNRSAPLFWRARVELIAEYEPLLPKLYDDDVVALMDQKILRDIALKGGTPPNTWQYHCLMWQEGLLATFLVCGIVVFEFVYVGDTSASHGDDDGNFYDTAFFISIGVTIFFLIEILLRFYVWSHTVKIMGSTSRHAIGGFFSNPFRFVDSSIVVIDMTLTIFELVAVSSDNSESTKQILKFARSLRFARAARWLRSLKMLRSCRFLAKLVNRVRLYLRPSRKDVEESLSSHYHQLEQSTSWAGRIVDLSKKMKHDLNRSTFHILQVFQDYQTEMKELQQSNVLNQNHAMEKKIETLEKSLNELKKKLGIQVSLDEPNTPKSPKSPPIIKKEATAGSVELQLPKQKTSGVKFKKISHLDQMMSTATLQTLRNIRDNEATTHPSTEDQEEGVGEEGNTSSMPPSAVSFDTSAGASTQPLTGNESGKEDSCSTNNHQVDNSVSGFGSDNGTTPNTLDTRSEVNKADSLISAQDGNLLNIGVLDSSLSKTNELAANSDGKEAELYVEPPSSEYSVRLSQLEKDVEM